MNKFIEDSIKQLEKAVGEIFQRGERIAGGSLVFLQKWVDFLREIDDESRKN